MQNAAYNSQPRTSERVETCKVTDGTFHHFGILTQTLPRPGPVGADNLDVHELFSKADPARPPCTTHGGSVAWRGMRGEPGDGAPETRKRLTEPGHKCDSKGKSQGGGPTRITLYRSVDVCGRPSAARQSAPPIPCWPAWRQRQRQHPFPQTHTCTRICRPVYMSWPVIQPRKPATERGSERKRTETGKVTTTMDIDREEAGLGTWGKFQSISGTFARHLCVSGWGV